MKNDVIFAKNFVLIKQTI